MKTFCVTTIIAAFLFLCANPSQAQTTQPKLNQVELLKQFSGNWLAELAKDTTQFWDCKAFGTGMECYWKNVAKNKIISEGKQIWGYDSKLDKIVAASLEKGKDIDILALWFTTDKKYVMTYYSEMSNPDKASIKVEGEFTSPDAYSETWYVNGKIAIRNIFKKVK
jgi:hypothetical protein